MIKTDESSIKHITLLRSRLPRNETWENTLGHNIDKTIHHVLYSQTILFS